MSRRRTEHRSRPAGRFRPPAAKWLACALGGALLAGTGITAGGQLAGPDPDAFDQAPFVGPPEASWRFGPPAPGIEALAQDLYVVTGHGGNVLVRVTPEGVIVAGELTSRSEAVASSIETVTDRPVRYVLHTHRHGTEPAGVPAAWQDATVVAVEPRATRPPGGDGRPAALPALAFSRGLSLFLGAAEVQLRHFGPAHTDSDAVVLFPGRGVLYAGDLVVRGMPFIDYAAGGGSRGWVETLDGILALDFETAVPGSGPPLTRREVQVFRDRFVTLRMRTMQLLYRDVARENALPLLRTVDLDWPFAAGGRFATRSFPALYDELAGEREEAREEAVAAADPASGETERP